MCEILSTYPVGKRSVYKAMNNEFNFLLDIQIGLFDGVVSGFY